MKSVNLQPTCYKKDPPIHNPSSEKTGKVKFSPQITWKLKVDLVNRELWLL